MTTITTLDDLLAAARRVADLPAGPRRDALWLRYSRLAAPLVDERADLLKKLTAGYTWLSRASGDDERYERNEDLWLDWLHQYEAIEDALREAEELIHTFPPPISGSTPFTMPLPRRTP